MIASPPRVELGAGDGRLTARLRRAGVDVIRLDRALPAGPGLRADLAALPFRSGSIGASVTGNCLRHFAPPTRIAALTEIWRATRGGGALLVLEDEPEPRDEAEANYRSTLAMLASVDTSRGTALERERLLAEAQPRWGPPRAIEVVENEEPVHDPLAPVRWLQARGVMGAEALSARVERHGMKYGRYWGVLFSRSSP